MAEFRRHREALDLIGIVRETVKVDLSEATRQLAQALWLEL